MAGGLGEDGDWLAEITRIEAIESRADVGGTNRRCEATIVEQEGVFRLHQVRQILQEELLRPRFRHGCETNGLRAAALDLGVFFVELSSC